MQPWKKKDIADKLTTLLHTDVRFYGRAFSWISISHASVIARGLATTFLMARIMPSELFGQFRYILAIFGIAGIGSLSGMSNAITQGIAKGDTSIASVALKKMLRFSPIGSFIAIGFATERLMRGETAVGISLFIVAALFPLYSISGIYSDILFGQQRIKSISRINTAINIIFTIGFVVVMTINRSLLVLVSAYFILDTGMRAFLTMTTLKKLPKTGNPSSYLRIGNHLSAINIVQAIAGRIDQVLVQFFGGYGSLASYNIAILIPEQIKGFVKSGSSMFLQRLARHEDTEKNLKNIRRQFWIATAVSAVAVAIYILMAPFLIPFLFPRYENAVLPTVVYAIGLITLPAIIGVHYFSIHQNIKKLWIFYTANSIIELTGTAILIPLFGGWGGIWAKTITRLTTWPLSYPKNDSIKKSKDDLSTDELPRV